MNGYRLAGDFLHLFALILLVFKLLKHKSSAGISGKSQILLSMVFIARYIDLFSTFISLYNTTFKITYITLTCGAVILVYFVHRRTYQHDLDTFWIEVLVIPALIVALLVNYNLNFEEVTWTFSIYLEAVAMWPQFYMIGKTRKVQTLIFCYLSLLGVYRSLYIMNWYYRYTVQNHVDPISSMSGIIQVIPFYVFWILCCTRTVGVTGKDPSWLATNLATENGVFVITVPEKNRITSDRVLLIDGTDESGEVGEGLAATGGKSNILFNIKN